MNGEDRLFLDVRQSARGMAWRHRLTVRQEAIALAIAQGHGVSDIVARVLAARGVTADNAEKFLDPTIRDLLPDPASLTDMVKAAARIADAVIRRERVAIFGDYDVDGAASSALMKRFLAHFDVPAEIYIPDRIFEGYGPNPEAMRDLADRGASLIVTVDCGTNSAASIDAARAAGSRRGRARPPSGRRAAAASRRGGQSQSRRRSVRPRPSLRGRRDLPHTGAGRPGAAPSAAFGTPPPDLLGYLDLAALATICDVVPLTGVNRAFVVKGLLAIRKQQNAGLAALARVSRIGEPVNAFHLSFLIGPRINAGGRIGDAALGSRLLATDDPVEAGTIAETLDRLNQERQAMEQEMLAEARAEADVELAVGAGPAILVTASDKWHPGIVGLLASRLKDHARRPAFAIAFNPNGIGTGSGRSVSGFDLGRLVRHGGRRRADRQGRRPRDGSRHHHRTVRGSASCAPSSSRARRPKCRDCATRNASRSMRHCRPKAQILRWSTRSRPPDPTAPDTHRRCWRCRATDCSTPARSAPATFARICNRRAAGGCRRSPFARWIPRSATS